MVRIYKAAGDAKILLGSAEIMLGYGYVSSHSADVHFGLGKTETVDVEVTLPHGRGKLTQSGVKVNQRLVMNQTKLQQTDPE
jgi:hypothetical protein